ncbi:curli-like amyloid fiber formation chaperone CsgH [uncultured Chryseobacterium sp.]|uniref:curli-like amyloid fiber formation chaperone CsgH n=1 Tax=uncultured Chryseobacterium sp. TaxID=259322 RepID=UPI002602391A|nr:curli-like amyloid fiber formation chaperone CsgH [uncultured Chryseobacterium sp.]
MISEQVFSQNETVKAKLESKNIEGVLLIDALAQNGTAIYQPLNYTMLSVRKTSSGNTSSSKQSGKFSLNPNESKIVTQSSVNFNPKDALKVYLFINDEKNQLVSKDSININTEQFSEAFETNKIKEDDIKLSGLTLDETKTIVGQNFYSKLISNLLLNSVAFAFPVRITELPTQGRSSQIQIFADDSNIYSFISKPDEEYLDGQVSQTIKQLFAYQNQKNVDDTGFKY